MGFEWKNCILCWTSTKPLSLHDLLQSNHKKGKHTLVFISHTIPISNVNINNFIRQAASDIVPLLKIPQPNLLTSLQISKKIQNDLTQLATILKTNKGNSILTNTCYHLQ